jgi:hypothetical protein
MQHDVIQPTIKIMFNPAQDRQGVESIGCKLASDDDAPQVRRLKYILSKAPFTVWTKCFILNS